MGFSINLTDQDSAHLGRDLGAYCLRAAFAYALGVLVPVCLDGHPAGYLLLSVVFVLMMQLDIQGDILRTNSVRLDNKNAHINALRGSIEEFAGVKHDFYNILQAYQGYLTVGDLDKLKQYHASLMHYTLQAEGRMELSKRMEEHPALVSLLMAKAEMAERQGVRLYINLQTKLDALAMDDMDLCRVLGCLLDNAIEAACDSQQKHVFFSMEPKPGGSRLIIINNSTAGEVDVKQIGLPGTSVKPGHAGRGISSVRRTLSRYANCTFHMTYYDQEFTAYLEIKPV